MFPVSSRYTIFPPSLGLRANLSGCQAKISVGFASANPIKPFAEHRLARFFGSLRLAERGDDFKFYFGAFPLQTFFPGIELSYLCTISCHFYTQNRFLLQSSRSLRSHRHRVLS
jgi:hypothetical protein